MKEGVASITALMVVKGLDSVSKLPKWSHLVPSESTEFNKAFIEEAAKASWEHKAVANRSPQKDFDMTERDINTGMPLHFAARKLAIEQTVRDAIAEGATQVVMVSGGFDSLSLRLHEEFPDVQFYETDHPDTQKVKLAALEKMEYTAGDNLHFISADLGKKNIDEVLKETAGFDPKQKTISIAEGLTMYLENEQVSRLLSSLHTIGSEGSQLVLSIMGSDISKNDSVNELHQEDEPHGKFFREPEDVPTFFKDHQFELQRFSSYQTLQDGVEGRTLKSGAETEDENYYVAAKTLKAKEEIPDLNIADIPPIDFALPERVAELSRGRGGRG